MAFCFRLTEAATADLEDIVAYIAVDSERAALKLADELEAAFLFLSEWPLAGHLRPDLTNSSVRFWPVGSYVIVYSATAAPVLIVAVLHGARDAASLLPDRLELL